MTPVVDIQRAIAVTWRADRRDAIAYAELSRIWSLDHQWMSPCEAEKAIDALVDSKWLLVGEDGIEPNVGLEDVDVPLGWWPNPAALTKPPGYLASADDSEAVVIENAIDGAPQSVAPSQSDLPRQERRLLRFVAQASGLSTEEVLRRSQRKQRALGPATLWICVLLVAKEQGLDIEGISATS